MTEDPPTVGERVAVVGVDGSQPSLDALRHTAALAAALGARVVAVFVRHVPPIAADPTSGQALSLVEDALDDLERVVRADVARILDAAGVSWSLDLRDGEPSHEILAAAREVGAACVVVGATVHGRVASVLLSSVASHLLHHSEVSVVIVRPDS